PGLRPALASNILCKPALEAVVDQRQHAGVSLPWLKITASGAWRQPLFRGRWRLPSWQTLHSVFA
ncbi:MAG TPA: hypothetical protein VKS21_12165, partial [Spirochaetota bacterium]|nr:hypothetical protein [Spirochaetota bacterium]